MVARLPDHWRRTPDGRVWLALHLDRWAPDLLEPSPACWEHWGWSRHGWAFLELPAAQRFLERVGRSELDFPALRRALTPPNRPRRPRLVDPWYHLPPPANAAQTATDAAVGPEIDPIRQAI